MELVFALFFGLILGSFLNVCILRLPQGVSITTPRSRCPQCKKLISWYDNVPVLSYVILGGKCRHCRKKISGRYPFIEGLTGVVSALLYLKLGFGVEWAIYLGFSCALIVLAFIDLDHRILPDVITLNGIWIGVVTSVYLAQPSPLVSRLFRSAGIEEVNPRIVALTASLSRTGVPVWWIAPLAVALLLPYSLYRATRRHRRSEALQGRSAVEH